MIGYAHAQVDLSSTLCENIPLADGALVRVYFTGHKWVAVVVHRNGEQDKPMSAETRDELLQLVSAEETQS